MLIVELNEFNENLLTAVSARLRLSNIQQFLNWKRVIVRTDDIYDSGFLEPWSQWVSVHTGVPSSEHGVKHLGDVPNLSDKQIWEYWSETNQTSIVWGVMNGSKGKAHNCKIFIPDPWTFSERPHPHKYDGLISLPRYLAKNSIKFSKLSAFLKGLRLLFTIVKNTSARDLIDAFNLLINGTKRFGFSHLVFIVSFEYLSVMMFLKLKAKIDTDHQIVFINMIAHVQHHYWKNPDGRDCDEIEFVAQVIDEIFRKIFESFDQHVKIPENLAVLNALSQKCTSEEPAWFLYVPKSHSSFVRGLGIQADAVEPLMTYDAHVLFSKKDKMEEAFEILNSLNVDGERLLFVEKDPTGKNKLFYRVDYSDAVNEESMLSAHDYSEKFFNVLDMVVQRTGKHVQESSVYSNRKDLSGILRNHEIAEWLKFRR